MQQFIFDTNYYRNYVTNKNFEEFNSKLIQQKLIENIKKHIIVFPIISAIELLNHLNEKNLTSEICHKALFVMVNHCGNTVDDKKKGSVVLTFYDLLTLYFFQVTSTNNIYNNNIFSLSQEIGNSLNCDILKTFENEINQIVKIKEEERENLVISFEQFYKESLNSNKKMDWHIFQKNPILKKEYQKMIKNKKIHKSVGLSFVELAIIEASKNDILINKIKFEKEFVNNHFKVSIDFFVKHIVSNLINIQKMEYFYKPKTDPKKRWNSFYDMQLIFAVEFENLKNRKTIFVTQEDKIRECFKKNGKEHLTLSITDYDKLLEI
jgi:hypothetical protein